MKTPMVSLLVLLLAGTPLFSKNDPSTWRQDGKPAPAAPNRAEKDGFGVELFLITDARFFDDWKKPETPVIEPAGKVMRDVPVYAVLLFADPGIDKTTGNPDVVYEFILRDPSGKIVEDNKDLVCWQGEFPTIPHNLQLAQSHAAILLENGDPLGKYTVKLVVKDRVKNVELTVSSTFEGVEIDYEKWMLSYYKHKDPTAFPGFLAFMKKGGYLKNEQTSESLATFIGAILHQHPELIAKYFPDISALPQDEQQPVAFLLAQSDTDEARAVLKKSKFADLADKPPTVSPTMLITSPSDLDMCWSEFLATGDTAYIRPVISALEFAKYAGSIDNYKKSAKTDEDQRKAYLEATWRSALWSLGSNAEQHPVVMQYLEDQIRSGKLSQNETAGLGIILSKLKPDKYKVKVEPTPTPESNTK